MTTLKQKLQKNTDHLIGYGLLTPNMAIKTVKEWLQQKRKKENDKREDNCNCWACADTWKIVKYIDDELLEELEK